MLGERYPAVAESSEKAMIAFAGSIFASCDSEEGDGGKVVHRFFDFRKFFNFEYVFDRLSVLNCNRKLCTLLCAFTRAREHLPRSAEFRTAEKSERGGGRGKGMGGIPSQVKSSVLSGLTRVTLH